jgi:hypothetical protein
MEEFHGFRIQFWEKLGFRFRSDIGYDGFERKLGHGSFGFYTFSLYIGKTLTIAAVVDGRTNDRENHGVFEDEAIEWFCGVSSEFRAKVENEISNNI